MTGGGARRALVGVAVAVVAAGGGTAEVAPAATSWWKNCTQLNKRYPHGVGRVGAHDRVKGSGKPVTRFTRSTKLYAIAMSHNRGLDRDHDGIACEKA